MTHLLLAVIYLAFVSLGLPDALLGAAWPGMYGQFGVPVSRAGLVSTLISVGTVVSSLNSHRMTRLLGPGRVTAFSTALTAAALFGFSFCRSFPALCLMAVPYGLGAGGVDAAINNYVAVHYPSRHMSWLHCMWGIGAAAGPAIMGAVLTRFTWPAGYRVVGALQLVLTALLFLSLPLWARAGGDPAGQDKRPAGGSASLWQTLRIPGVGAVVITFFCYCALESTAGLWASSFLVLARGVDETTAASWAGLFYIGMTAGRFINGFLTVKLSDRSLIRLGAAVAALGAALLLFSPGGLVAAGLVTVGLGCAPVYPCMIHSTPVLFGAERSQSVIGVQMAAAYLGTALVPPFFGLLTRLVSPGLYPLFLLLLVALMVLAHTRLPAEPRGQAAGSPPV